MRARPLAILALIGLGLWVLYLLVTSTDPSTDPIPIEPSRAEGAEHPADNRGEEKLEGAARTEIRDAAGDTGDAGSGPKLGALLVRQQRDDYITCAIK